MSAKAGTLLWNRVFVTFKPSTNTVSVDTGLKQVAQTFAGMSPGEPGLTQRVQVIPMAPLAGWTNIVHGEPYVGPGGTVWVDFSKTGIFPEPPFQNAPFNVLFWDPHSIVGPGQADTYNPQD
jgi:hypothetical protein